MAKLAVLCLLAFAVGCAVATQNPTPNSTHVMARVEFDNTVEEVNANKAEIKKEAADKLCSIPEKDVEIWKVQADSSLVNTQTVVYITCKAPNNKLEDVMDDCEDTTNRVQFNDELEDSTGGLKGELEVDDIDCRYVENGQPVAFTVAEQAAPNVSSPAPSSAASFAPSVLLAGLAATGAAMLLA